MTYSEPIKKYNFLLLVLVCFSCEKPTLNDPAGEYISQPGIFIEDSEYDLTIPENALTSDQFISVYEYNGYQLDPYSYSFLIDTTSFYRVVSRVIRFNRFNCDELQIPAELVLYRNSDISLSFYNQKAKPYCIDVNDDITDEANWEELEVGDRKSKSITFEFVNLEKAYFIGWHTN